MITTWSMPLDALVLVLSALSTLSLFARLWLVRRRSPVMTMAVWCCTGLKGAFFLIRMLLALPVELFLIVMTVLLYGPSAARGTSAASYVVRSMQDEPNLSTSRVWLSPTMLSAGALAPLMYSMLTLFSALTVLSCSMTVPLEVTVCVFWDR